MVWDCFEWSYADEHPLALEVDVGDGELVGERHDCGGGCVCVWSLEKFELTWYVYLHNC
jgi:hypothetical protein